MSEDAIIHFAKTHIMIGTTFSQNYLFRDFKIIDVFLYYITYIYFCLILKNNYNILGDKDKLEPLCTCNKNVM